MLKKLLPILSKPWVAWFAAFFFLPFSFLSLSCLHAGSVKKDNLVVGMLVEPPGLDPTVGSNAAIGDLLHYNLYEGLIKVNEDRSLSPLLAESWTISPDFKTYTFTLRQNVTFHNGDKFTAKDVLFSFERAKAPGTLNKDKALFSRIETIQVLDDFHVALVLKEPHANLLFRLGLPGAVITNEKSAATNATHPVGTGPFAFHHWQKGVRLTLKKWPHYRFADSIHLQEVTFRFMIDPMAQVLHLLSGETDVWPGGQAAGQNLEHFRHHPNFSVLIGGTSGKSLLIFNHQREFAKNLLVRKAFAYALDRQSIITAATEGYGPPIGSHMVPEEFGYHPLTHLYEHNTERARGLLEAAGYTKPLELTMRLPSFVYAMRSGEVIQAQLAAAGIKTNIEIIDFPQWLSQVYHKRDYDLTIIAHVEPLDLDIYANPNYYFQYNSPAFRHLLQEADRATDEAQRLIWLEKAQIHLAEDVANVFLFQLPKMTIMRKGWRGFWRNAPVFANDLSGVAWQE